jgi:hypothetical protein
MNEFWSIHDKLEKAEKQLQSLCRELAQVRRVVGRQDALLRSINRDPLSYPRSPVERKLNDYCELNPPYLLPPVEKSTD